MIRVDTNAGEDALALALERRRPEGVSVVRERLDVGDVLLTTTTTLPREEGEGGGRGPEDAPTLCFERKTWSDLASSLCDGRYAEQKSRILDNGTDSSACQYAYVVEGPIPSWDEARRGPSSKCMWTALVKTALRDGLHVLHANTTEDTASLLLYALDQLRKGELAPDRRPRRSVPGVQKRKRDNLVTSEGILRAMLTTVPGMSADRATAVCERYPSVASLQACTASDLSQIVVGSRKLGPKLASVLKSVMTTSPST